MSTRCAIKLNPESPMAYSNLGNISKDLGNHSEALDSYLEVINYDPEFYAIYTSISHFLNEVDVSLLDKIKLKNILNVLLDRNDLRHQDLFKAFKFIGTPSAVLMYLFITLCTIRDRFKTIVKRRC